jgi:Fe2+ or Zn2+ uptake regulation protein
VYKLLLAEKIDVGLATIYRVLMQFAEAGILFRRHFESGHAVFELNEGQHHDHLVCTGCGKVDEFVDEGIELRQNEIAAERGFVLHEHAIAVRHLRRLHGEESAATQGLLSGAAARGGLALHCARFRKEQHVYRRNRPPGGHLAQGPAPL